MLHIIKKLREICDYIEAGLALPEELASWLETSLREYLEHRSSSVDDALGLHSAKGGVPWWLEEGMRRRDGALRALAARFLDSETVNAKAIQISLLAQRFAAANWRQDRDLAEMPARYQGTVKEYLWIAFKSGAPMPLGARRLRTILAGAEASPPEPLPEAQAALAHDACPDWLLDDFEINGAAY